MSIFKQTPKRPHSPAMKIVKTMLCGGYLRNASRLKPLLHSCRDRPQTIVNLARGFSENQADDGLARDAGVLKATEDVNFGVGEHDARARGVLDGVFGLAVFSCNTADGAGKMITLQGLDILDLEG